jgi:hypothetical protein
MLASSGTMEPDVMAAMAQDATGSMEADAMGAQAPDAMAGGAAPGPGAPLTVPGEFDRFFAVFQSLRQAHNPQAQQLVHPDLGYYRMEAPGAACIGSKLKPTDLPWCTAADRQAGPCNELRIKAAMALEAGNPKGGCEGYPGVQEALLYSPVKAAELPSFQTEADLAAGKLASRLTLPGKYRTAPLMRVQSFEHSQLQHSVYFIQIDRRWYLLAVDLCTPCGA